MEIKFNHGGGWAGESYFMEIQGKVYPLCTNEGDENQAKEIALKILLDEYGIIYTDEMVFKHNGQL
jgi:hypothetical protein